jgi:hypothetical protein
VSLVSLPFGVRKIEKYDPEFSKRLERTVASYDRQSCIHALRETISLYQELRAKIPEAEMIRRGLTESEALKSLSDYCK